MPANSISGITQDEINQLKEYRDEVNVFLNGVKVTRRESLYTSEELIVLRGWERDKYWRKARILIGWEKFTPIRSIVGRCWPGELPIIEEVKNEIEADTKDLDGNWMQVHEGRLIPTFAASHGFEKLIKRLEYIINTLAAQTEADRHKTKRPRRREKTPPQLLHETRERNAARLLAQNAGLSCSQLAEKLECNKSTIVRLKAWKQRGVLQGERRRGMRTRGRDGETYTDVEG